jgi:hypothetical protein
MVTVAPADLFACETYGYGVSVAAVGPDQRDRGETNREFVQDRLAAVAVNMTTTSRPRASTTTWRLRPRVRLPSGPQFPGGTDDDHGVAVAGPPPWFRRFRGGRPPQRPPGKAPGDPLLGTGAGAVGEVGVPV